MSEVETAILFLSTNRKVIFEKIQNVIRSSSYEPVKNGTENLHDLYYDTADKKLEACNLYKLSELTDQRIYSLISHSS